MSDNNINWDDDDTTTPVAVPPPPSFNTTTPSEFPNQELIKPEPVEALNIAQPIVSVATAETDGESEHVTVVQVDGYGNEVTTVVDMALPPLNRDEALEITEKIKGTTNLLYLLIKRAHAGKAYLALGYSSFEKYVNAEFNYSRSYAYKLLNQATVIEAIQAVVPEGTEVYVGELASRSLKHALPELVSEIEERTTDLDPNDATQVLNDVIREMQQRQTEERSFEEDYDDDSSFHDPSFNDNFEFGEQGGAGNGLDDDIDFLGDDDGDLDQFLSDKDPMQLVRQFEEIWNLITGLQTFSDLSNTANLDELLPAIPTEKTDEISSLIKVNIEWLNVLDAKWDELQEQRALETNEETSDETDESGETEF